MSSLPAGFCFCEDVATRFHLITRIVTIIVGRGFPVVPYNQRSFRKTLRQFCAKNKLDPGNISRLERGLMPPPQGSNKLEEYARFLEIKKGTDDWYTFFDLARIEAGRIPEGLLNNESVAASLPILFRTLRGQKISEKKLEKLVELIKKS